MPDMKEISITALITLSFTDAGIIFQKGPHAFLYQPEFLSDLSDNFYIGCSDPQDHFC
jgi:hypothetical protein